MRKSAVAAGPAFAILMLTLGFGSVTVANQNDATIGPGERLIRGAPRPNVDWSAADRALRAAMDPDPSYTSGTADGLTQPAAIVAWKEFLERDDLTREQQIFAWWRVGALYAYNLAPSRGESADYEKAERAFAKTRKLSGAFVTRESLNSATVWASLPGTENERARRLAIAFRWLFTRCNDDVDGSAELINRNGYLIDKKFFSHIAHRESALDRRKTFLHQQLVESRNLITKMVTERI